VEARHQEVSGRVGGLTNDLAAITDRLEEIKETMNDRGQSMTDTSPLVKIRAALQQIKVHSHRSWGPFVGRRLV
jgi:intraflagellar transport protein 57